MYIRMNRCIYAEIHLHIFFSYHLGKTSLTNSDKKTKEEATSKLNIHLGRHISPAPIQDDQDL